MSIDKPFQGLDLGLEEEGNSSSAKEKIEQLRKEIDKHNHSYYIENNPTISDKEFDMLLKQLERLEEKYPQYDDPNSPTHRVGKDLTTSFESFAHKRPMLSLANTYNFDEVQAFYQRCQKALDFRPFHIVAELKFDGVSIALTYEDGRLVQALTRGDGIVGDDVTSNVRTINSIPLVLRQGETPFPHQLEVRGEIILPYAEFDRLNREREDSGDPLFANPRNAASGTLKTLNTREVRRRKLDAFLYYALSDKGLPTSHYQRLDLLQQWGFKVSTHRQLCADEDSIHTFIQEWDEKRHALPYATDGVVLKVDEVPFQEELGATAKSPRWAIAYKFETERVASKLQRITFQVGRTGVITPVANFEPVLISGSMVRRATLHNADFMTTLDLREGDTLFIEKGGEIIPKVVSVDLSQRIKGAKPIAFTQVCPDCGTPLTRKEGEVAIYCPNQWGCPTQVKEGLLHFCGRKAADIRLGKETIEALYNKKLALTIPDLYSLTAEKIALLEGYKEQATHNLLQSIDHSRQRPFHAILFGIGIPYVGEGTARLLTAHFGSIDKLATAGLEEICQVEGIGEITAHAIVDYFAVPKNQKMIDRLKEAGLNLKEKETPKSTGGRFYGKSIVISGVFKQHSRQEYEAMIIANGGKSVGSISKKTAFILAGDSMGPSKKEKALSLGIEMLTEEQFLSLLSSNQEEV